LAWHYFYGIGCEKNVEEAKKIIKWVCTEKGEYWYPSLIALIKDMDMDRELRYNPNIAF
jgi:ABC-type Fe3+ transport system substrate-binding protein